MKWTGDTAYRSEVETPLPEGIKSKASLDVDTSRVEYALDVCLPDY